MAAHYLDEIPLDFSNPAVKELRALLADSYFRVDEVIAIVQDIGAKPASINWDRPMVRVWGDVLSTLQRQGKLRDLLRYLIDGPNKALAGRLRELLSAQPAGANVRTDPAPHRIVGEANQLSLDPGLDSDRVTMLRDAVAAFDRFVAIEAFSSADGNTEVLLNLPPVDGQLNRLSGISVTTWPVRWANEMAGAVARTRAMSNSFSQYANRREREELRDSVHQIRNLIMRQYPDLFRLPGAEEVERHPEFSMEFRERCDVGAPWRR
jgi:Effector-associated domain 1